MNIEISSTCDDPRRKTIREGLRCYNKQFSSGTSEQLSVFAVDDQQHTIGGLIGVTFGCWLHVDELWVSERERGKSIGAKLLVAAEQEAMHRGCTGSTLDTYSFQALDFYLKQGYTRFGTLDGYAGKYERYYLEKKLPVD